MLVFPAIDLLEGQAVRLEQGRRETATVYSSAPWELAAAFAAAGASRLHVIDLDAAFSGGSKDNRPTIQRIAGAPGTAAGVAASGSGRAMEVEVGGGIRSVEDCQRLFSLGADYAVLGTAAIKDPGLLRNLCRQFPGRIVVAVDARGGKVAVEGWTEDTAARALDVGAAVAEAGAAAVLYTDIGRDGMRSGPNLEATTRLVERIAPCPVIASGGVARLEDLDQVRDCGAHAVVVGKAIYERAFTIEEALARAAGTGA